MIDKNIKALQEIFDSLNPINSYSLAIFITQQLDNNKLMYKTIDEHYLVNNTTNAELLMKHIYAKIEVKKVRYQFKISDVILCKYKPLYLKVNDPKFTSLHGKISNTISKHVRQ
jgi:hypothetical protein